jgi:thiamine biosynthesis lipoprotein
MTTVVPVAEGVFAAIGTTNRVLSLHPEHLDVAVEAARDHLTVLDAAVSRFRTDSEVSRLHAAAAHAAATASVSPMFVDYLEAALRMARITDGLVDPTVGGAVVAAGYDADMDVVRARTVSGGAGDAARVPGWRAIVLDRPAGVVTVPQGCLIDLGATAKAHAADRVAAELALRLTGGGFLVNFGGDIAVTGACPDGGWQIGLQAADGDIRQVVASTGQALATSSTRLRTWTTGAGESRHHIVDPRTGGTAPAVWAQVSCAAASALEANAASTAAIVLGQRAPRWLTRNGIPARLDRADGVIVTTPGWPAPEGEVS